MHNQNNFVLEPKDVGFILNTNEVSAIYGCVCVCWGVSLTHKEKERTNINNATKMQGGGVTGGGRLNDEKRQ